MQRCPREIAWRCRFGVRLEIAGRADNRRALVARHPDRDHVAFDELAEMNARVEPTGNEVQGAIVRGDVEHDIGIATGELLELGAEEHLRREAWRDEANGPGRSGAQPGDVLQHRANVRERRAQV